MKIEDIVHIDRLRTIQAWCYGLGVSLLLMAFMMLPVATRNPKVFWSGLFPALREGGALVWMVIPTGIIGLVTLLVGYCLSRRIKAAREKWQS